MPYQVLARKWRPQTFAEVVGQEHVARTLKNAILQNRIGHAYLFVGSRGIGKTTSARIFAKALNCTNNQDGEPCCQCENCREIAAGNSLDVIEIDGASHNKVEDIRDIRDNVQYTPTKSKYKIYIIDEVHMLTTSAWNALLKTLEEPPEHVKFIFATTEPHKVLPTIISRCQRFDLRRIPVPLIVRRLREIADGEHIYIEDSALAVIARAADGGMRDAQSILDQMIAFCGGLSADETITERDVVDVFGLASGTELREIAIALLANDLNRAFATLNGLADAGRDLEKMFGDLVEYMRNLMLASVCTSPEKFLEISPAELEDMRKLAASVEPILLQRVLQSLVEQEWSLRSALNKRVYLEVILARAATNAHSVQLDDIASHLNVLSGLLPKEQVIQPRRFPSADFPPPPVPEPPRPAPAASPAPEPKPLAPPPAPTTPAMSASSQRVAPQAMEKTAQADITRPAFAPLPQAPLPRNATPKPDSAETNASPAEARPSADAMDDSLARPLSPDAISIALDEASEADNDGEYPVEQEVAVQSSPEMPQDGIDDLVSRFASREDAEGSRQTPRANESSKRRGPATQQQLAECAKHPFAERVNQMFNAHVIDARVHHDEANP